MLVIRLKPVGRKHQISFRIVVAEKRSKLNGPYREDLGFYNPQTDKFSVKIERAKYWLSIGAQPSDTVYNIFVDAKVLSGPKKTVKIKTKKEEKEMTENSAEATSLETTPAETAAN